MSPNVMPSRCFFTFTTLTIFKCTNQWHEVHSPYPAAITTFHLQNSFIITQRSSVPIKQQLPIPPSGCPYQSCHLSMQHGLKGTKPPANPPKILPLALRTITFCNNKGTETFIVLWEISLVEKHCPGRGKQSLKIICKITLHITHFSVQLSM